MADPIRTLTDEVLAAQAREAAEQGLLKIRHALTKDPGYNGVRAILPLIDGLTTERAYRSRQYIKQLEAQAAQEA